MDARFNAWKVKFEMLDQITRPIFISQRISTVNIFISLDDIYSRLKNSQVNREFQCCGRLATKQMISNILNLVAHYREWAVRKRVNVKMIVYYTTSVVFESKMFIPNYRKYYNEKNSFNNSECFYINECIREAASMLTTIFQYIDSAYIIDTGKVEPSAFPYICATEYPEFNSDWNFLITRDYVEIQYALFNKFSVIYPKGEESLLINAGNLWSFIASREKIEGSLSNKYPPVAYVPLLAVMGDKKRSIPKVKGLSWKTLFNIMDDIKEKNPDLDDSNIIIKFMECLEKRRCDMNMIQNNNDVISMKYIADITNTISKEYMKSQFIDTPDYANLIDLNRQPNMFERCPINIKFLTDQVEVKAIDPFKIGFMK